MACCSLEWDVDGHAFPLAKTFDFGDGFGLDILQGLLHGRNNCGLSLDSPKPLDFARGETCSIQEKGCKGVNSLLNRKGWPLC